MAIYLLPPEGNFYKTNLHCHSTVSDGKFTPAELKKIYRQQGYSAIAYTDHQLCVPHPELTDESFIALTGLEIAFGIGRSTSIHVCGIARDPLTRLEIPNDPENTISRVNGGIRKLQAANFITTFNHPRWSGVSPEEIARIGMVDNMEVVNGFEMVQDGYGDSGACFESELRRGRRVFPVAADDSHTSCLPNTPGHEYFRGFTVVKAPELTYNALIEALDAGSFFASTGPRIYNLWLDGNRLHLECSAVCGVYVHGQLYSHRAAKVEATDCMEAVELDVTGICESSDYLYLQIVNTRGQRAFACPYWFGQRGNNNV